MNRAEILGALTTIARGHHGIIPPEAVVAAARDPASPLHSHFTWDDTEAARQWRIEEARRMLRVFVRYEPGEGSKVVPVSVFVSLPSDRRSGGGYRLVTEVLHDDALRSELLVEARRTMVAFQMRFGRLEEVARVIDEMRALVGAPPE